MSDEGASGEGAVASPRLIAASMAWLGLHITDNATWKFHDVSLYSNQAQPRFATVIMVENQRQYAINHHYAP